MRALSRQDVLGLVLLVLSIVFLVGLALAQAIRHGNHVGSEILTAADLVPSIVVLIDVSDTLTELQVVELQARVPQLPGTKFQEGQVVAIYALGAFEEGSLRRIFSRRMPQRMANPLFENPRLVGARFDSLYARPLQQAIAGLKRCEPTAASPIMAAITLLAEELHGGGGGSPRLIVVSDCLERTAEFSLYRDPQDFQAFTRSGHSVDRQADLRGIEVDVWLLTRARDEAHQGAALRQFWEAYLHASGARSVHFRLL